MKHRIEDIDKKKDLFKVPENYFEDLPMRIQKRMHSGEARAEMSWFSAWRLASASSLVIFTVFVFMLVNQPENPERLLAEVPTAELLAYLEELDVDEYDIASVVGNNTEVLELEEYNYLEGVELEDHAIDDILTEYNLNEEML